MTLTKLLFSSKNSGKLREVKLILADLPQLDLEVLSVLDFPSLADFDVAETGQTLAQNALLKAKAFAQKLNLPTIADDFGIKVKALNGQPGVKSKRWVKGSDHGRNQALLAKLETATDRSALYQSEICFYDPRTNFSRCFTGLLPGKIALKPQGSDGYGYDPIFIPAGFNQTIAQLGLEQKKKIGHRRLALEKFKDFLNEEFLLN